MTTIVKYKNKKNRYEIICNKSYITEYKKLNSKEDKYKILNKLLISDCVFSNYSKGEIAKMEDIYKITNSTNKNDAILYLIDHGDIPVSASERKQLTDQKFNEIVNFIHKNYLNPVNKKPYSLSIIKSSLKSIKGFSIDYNKSAESQFNIYKKKISLPLVKNWLIVNIELTHSQIGKGMSILNKYANIINENYHKNGATIEIESNQNNYEHIIQSLKKI